MPQYGTVLKKLATGAEGVAMKCVLVAVILAISACAPASYTQLNQRQVRTMHGQDQELHSAVLANAKKQGWTVTEKSEVLIVAQSPVDSGSGMTTRDEWHFRIEPGRVSAQLIPQMKKGKRWKSTTKVSEGYSYARENYQLDNITALVPKPEAVETPKVLEALEAPEAPEAPETTNQPEPPASDK